MQPTSLARVLKIAENHYPGRDREWLVGEINKVRQTLWKDPNKRELVFRADGAESVVQFVDPTICGSRRTFTGITLPVNIVSVEHIEVDGHRIPVESQVENLPAGYNGNRSRPVAEQLATKVCLQHDLPYTNLGPVCFFGQDAKDNGSRIGVEYVDANGAIHREDILLSTSGPETTACPVKFLSVTLPERCGWIKIKTADGFELGSYHPSIYAPRHLRLHINGVYPGKTVKWVGMKEPMDVVYDSDEVEMSAQMEWMSMFTWCELHLKTTRSREEQMTYQSLSMFDAAASQSDLKATMGTPTASLRPKNSSVMFKRMRLLGSGLGSKFSRRY